MSGAIELQVGGERVRVVSTASREELTVLAAELNERLVKQGRSRGRSAHQSLVLVALSLAHELEHARRRAEALEARQRTLLSALLERVEGALAKLPEVEVEE